jgi:hypothetical protein
VFIVPDQRLSYCIKGVFGCLSILMSRILYAWNMSLLRCNKYCLDAWKVLNMASQLVLTEETLGADDAQYDHLVAALRLLLRFFGHRCQTQSKDK